MNLDPALQLYEGFFFFVINFEANFNTSHYYIRITLLALMSRYPGGVNLLQMRKGRGGRGFWGG